MCRVYECSQFWCSHVACLCTEHCSRYHSPNSRGGGIKGKKDVNVWLSLSVAEYVQSKLWEEEE